MKRLYFLLVLILLPAFCVFSEEKKHDVVQFKQPEIESMDISPNPVGRGDLFTITVIVDHDDSSDVELPLEGLPEELVLWRGPYIRSFIDSDKNNGPVRKIQVTVTFKAKNSGRMIFPALTVMVGTQELETDPRLLNVGLYKNRKLYMPIETEWQSGFDRIYAGEAVPLSLMVLNQEVVVIFDRIRVAYPRDGFFEEAGGFAKITSVSEGDITLYDIPAATYIFTPPVAGEVKIPSAGVDYDGITGWSDDLYLNIRKPPVEIKSTGAVGNFKYRTSIEKKSVEAGENFMLTATVEGAGNLNFLKLPEPVVDDCLLVSTEEVSDYKPGQYGFSGVKTVKWIYTAEKPGTAELGMPDFVYLDKETDQVMTSSGADYSLQILAKPEVSAEAGPEKLPFAKININGNTSSLRHNHYLNWFGYIWLLPGLLFFIFSFVFKGRRFFLVVLLTLVVMVAVFSGGKFVMSDKGLEPGPEINTDVLYNRAIDAYGEGQLTKSLHNLRSAIYGNPVNSLYRETLHWMESENGFVNSVSPSVRLHPDLFYYILIFSFNLFFISAVFKIFRPGGGISVLLILFGFIVIFSTSMMIYSHEARETRTAVVCQDGTFLKKIPRETAENWVDMDAGTALRILDQSGNFLLVETGLGVKGWVPENCLIKDH